MLYIYSHQERSEYMYICTYTHESHDNCKSILLPFCLCGQYGGTLNLLTESLVQIEIVPIVQVIDKPIEEIHSEGPIHIKTIK